MGLEKDWNNTSQIAYECSALRAIKDNVVYIGEALLTLIGPNILKHLFNPTPVF